MIRIRKGIISALRGLFIAFLLLASLSIHAQEKKYGFELIDWEELHITESLDTIPCEEHYTIFTNREFLPNKKAFFNDSIGPYKELYLVEVCASNGEFYCRVEKGLEEPFESVPGSEKDLVFFVHGDGKSFPSTLHRARGIREVYDVEVVVFDYPSYLRGVNGLKNFFNSKGNAKVSVDQMDHVFQRLQESVKEDPKKWDGRKRCLFFHSLGNYLLAEWIRDSLHTDLDPSLFSTVLLNAAAAREKGHQDWLRKLTIDGPIYLTYNKKDHSLRGAHLITFRKQLGEGPEKPLVDGVEYINFRNVAGSAHNCYLQPEILNGENSVREFYNEVFHGRVVDLQNSTRFEPSRNGIGYSIR